MITTELIQEIYDKDLILEIKKSGLNSEELDVMVSTNTRGTRLLSRVTFKFNLKGLYATIPTYLNSAITQAIIKLNK